MASSPNPDYATEQFLTKYRPKTFNEVIGNTAVVRALANQVRDPSPLRTYLFTGITGIGKTTLGRIIAEELHAYLYPIDCGLYSGLSYARSVLQATQFATLLPQPNRLFLFDEAQSITRKSWDAYLTFVEEVPNGVYVAFCTTSPMKVPDTVKSRSFHVALQPVDPITLRDFIDNIAQKEGRMVRPDVLMAIAQGAGGSVRQALSYLQIGHSAHSVSELIDIIPDIRDAVIAIEPEPEHEEQPEIPEHYRRREREAETARMELDEIAKETSPTVELPTHINLNAVAKALEGLATISEGIAMVSAGIATILRDPKVADKPTHNVSEHGRRRISEAQKRRWAVIKGNKKK